MKQDTIKPDPIPTPQQRRRRFWFPLVCILIAFLLTEAGARLLKLGPPVYAPRRFEPAGGVPFTAINVGGKPLLAYQPDSVFASVYDPSGDRRGYLGADGRVVYRINSLGFRGPPVAIDKPEDGFRVLCLGDSITFGEGVHEEHTFPARLQGLLADALPTRRVEVINAGVQAHGTIEQERMFFARGLPLNPDVVILQFFLNDAMAMEETIRQNEAVTREYDLSWPGRVSRIWEIVERRRHAARLQREYSEATRRSFESAGWDACRESIRRMAAVCRGQEIRLVVVIFPILWDLDAVYPFEDLHAKVAQACSDAGCESLDLLDVYRGTAASTLWVHPTDHHPNELAHRLAAERLSRYLLKSH